MFEEWKDIQGYEGAYQVSNHGRVKSLARTDRNGHTRKEKILKQIQTKNGYLRVHFSKDMVDEWVFVHRLAAMAFLEKPDGCDIVNHKDNNPRNNHVSNLEWTTYEGNMQWASAQGRMKYKPDNLRMAQESHKTPVIAMKDGECLRFESQTEAANTLGIARGHIAAACRKEYGYKTIGGYTFEYTDKCKQMTATPRRIGKPKEEWVEELRERMKNNTYMNGRTLSAETKSKISTAASKEIVQYSLDGVEIARYKSGKEATQKTGITHADEVANGKRKSAGGYLWKWGKDT